MEAGLHSGAQSHCLNKRLPVERTKMCQGKSPKLSSELKYRIHLGMGLLSLTEIR